MVITVGWWKSAGRNGARYARCPAVAKKSLPSPGGCEHPAMNKANPREAAAASHFCRTDPRPARLFSMIIRDTDVPQSQSSGAPMAAPTPMSVVTTRIEARVRIRVAVCIVVSKLFSFDRATRRVNKSGPAC